VSLETKIDIVVKNLNQLNKLSENLKGINASNEKLVKGLDQINEKLDRMGGKASRTFSGITRSAEETAKSVNKAARSMEGFSKLGDVMGSPAGKRAMGVAGLGAAMGLNKASQDIATTVGWLKNLRSVAFGALNPFSKGAEVAAVKTGFLSGKLSQLAALAAAHPVIAASMGVAYMAFGDKLTNVAVQGVPKLIKGLDKMGKAAFDAKGFFREMTMEINISSEALKKFQTLGMKGKIVQNTRASKAARAGSGFADFSRRADQIDRVSGAVNRPDGMFGPFPKTVGRPAGMPGPNRPGAENAVTKSIRRHLELEAKRTGVLRQTWEIEKKIEQSKKNQEKITKRDSAASKKAARDRLKNWNRIRRRKGGMMGGKGGENLMLGAGFPLLFGGGVGSVGGGVGGALLGNKMGMQGFGAQILGSAIGTMMDTAVQKAAKLGESLRTLNMDDLVESGVRLSAELQTQITLLTRAGNIEKARALAAQQVQKQTGASAGSLQDVNNAVNILKSAWNDIVGSVGAFLGIIGSPVIAALGLVLRLVSEVFKSFNETFALIRKGLVFITGWTGLPDLIAGVTDGLNPALQESIAKAAELGRKFENNTKLLAKQLEITAAMPTGNTFSDKRARAQGELSKKLLGFDAETKSQLGDLRTDNQALPAADLANLEGNFMNERITKRAGITTEFGKEMKKINEQEQQVIGKLERQNELKAALFGIDQKIAQARSAEDKELEFRLNAQKEIASITSKLMEDTASSDDAEKQRKIEAAKLDIAKVNFALQTKIDEFRKEKKDEAEDVLTQLQNENNLLQGKIDGNEEEIKQHQVIEKIVDKIGEGYRTQVTALVQKNGELTKEAENTKKLDKQWGKIKETIATGLTDAITGLIDGTKSLGESLASIAKQIGSMMLKDAIMGAFKLNAEGGYERGGFQAFASGGVATRPTMGLVGEAGEDEYIIPASKMAQSMQRYSAGARGESVIPGTGQASSGGGAHAQTTVNYSGPILNFNSEEFVPKSAIGQIINSAASRGARAGEARTLSTLQNSRSRRSNIGL